MRATSPAARLGALLLLFGAALPLAGQEPTLADDLLARIDQAADDVNGGDGGGRRLLLPALLAVSTLGSEDLTCIAGGLLVARQKLSFAAAAGGCFLGIFFGDLLLVFVGRALGEGVLRRWPFSRLLTRERLERSEDWFRRSGPRVVFVSRFLPGSRLPLYLAAGVLRAPLPPIAAALAVAAAVWTPLLVGLSAWTGGAMLRLFREFERFALPALALAALLTLLAIRVVVPLFSWRGRRLLLARWRRLTRWEFWPAWLFQAPVVLHALRLGWRHGGIGTFAAANPGIPAGGFVEESKSAILAALGAAPVARFARVEADGHADLVAAARAAMTAAALDFPVVVKPDIGERGFGVRVVRSAAELGDALDPAAGAWLVQEYVAGEEFGVFYVRPPDAARGRILSITAKRFPAVTGDGSRTLEELILADDRAVCMAELYLAAHDRRLGFVPAAGESVQLVEIGNHCRGTVFLDGRAHATPELLAAIEMVARGFEGFYFGRFDLRVPSVDDLRAGRNLRILELNGVTSEATHIYDPQARLLAGWRTLFEQWRIAFEIGAANVARGATRPSLRELLALLGRRRSRFATIARRLAERKS